MGVENTLNPSDITNRKLYYLLTTDYLFQSVQVITNAQNEKYPRNIKIYQCNWKRKGLNIHRSLKLNEWMCTTGKIS